MPDPSWAACAEWASKVYENRAPDGGELLEDDFGINRALLRLSSPHEPLIAFRGTDNLGNALQDLLAVAKTKMEVQQPGVAAATMNVGKGFEAALSSLKPDQIATVAAANATKPAHWLITGHSLGGAMAILFGLRCVALGHRVKVVTFGAPQVGCASFQATVRKMQSSGVLEVHRLVNVADPVPHLLGCLTFTILAHKQIWISAVRRFLSCKHS